MALASPGRCGSMGRLGPVVAGPGPHLPLPRSLRHGLPRDYIFTHIYTYLIIWVELCVRYLGVSFAVPGLPAGIPEGGSWVGFALARAVSYEGTLRLDTIAKNVTHKF